MSAAGLERCKEVKRGELVYFSGGVGGAAGTARIMLEVYTLATEQRFISDAQAAVLACDEELAGDVWWSESEWEETRDWVRAELAEEGEVGLLAQLEELEGWAVDASTRAAAAISRGGGGGGGGGTAAAPAKTPKGGRKGKGRRRREKASSKETAAGAGTAGAVSVQAQIEALYRQFNPEKVGQVPDLMAKYAGMEDDLLASVREKYGVVIDKDEL